VGFSNPIQRGISSVEIDIDLGLKRAIYNNEVIVLDLGGIGDDNINRIAIIKCWLYKYD